MIWLLFVLPFVNSFVLIDNNCQLTLYHNNQSDIWKSSKTSIDLANRIHINWIGKTNEYMNRYILRDFKNNYYMEMETYKNQRYFNPGNWSYIMIDNNGILYKNDTIYYNMYYTKSIFMKVQI